jgi:SAM-dependent methyltransferase
VVAGNGSEYLGEELSVFAAATTWAETIARQVGPYLRGTVFEAGAGLGTRTRRLSPLAAQWVAVEPDRDMAARLAGQAAAGTLPGHVEVVPGTLRDLPAGRLADAILYLDVLEHIESDREELALAAARLRPGGHLVVLSPAHAWLYTPFDRAIGHHRRYTFEMLAAIGPPSLQLVRRRMLDSAGLLASAANRFLLRSAMPSGSQVLFWDRVLVRASRVLDPLLGHRVGKSVLMVWRRPD